MDCGYYILEWNYTNPSLRSLNTKSPLSILVILFWIFLGKIIIDLAVRLFDGESLIVLANYSTHYAKQNSKDYIDLG